MKTEFRVVKVTYENGDTITTSMSPKLTNEEMLDYFRVGKYFNIGSVEDNMQRVVKAEILR